MDRKKWQKNAALRIKAVRTVGLLDQGVPVDTALNYANSEYKEALAAIDRPTIAELKSTMDAKCTAAGLPPVLIPGTATEYKSGGRLQHVHRGRSARNLCRVSCCSWQAWYRRGQSRKAYHHESQR